MRQRKHRASAGGQELPARTIGLRRTAAIESHRDLPPNAPPPTPEALDAPVQADSEPPSLSVSRPAEDAIRRPWTRLAWDAGLILALVLFVWLAAQVKGFTVPFIIAFIIAFQGESE